MEQIANELSLIAKDKGKDPQVTFLSFLDYVIDCFSLDRLCRADGDYTALLAAIRDEGNDLFPVFTALVFKSVEMINANGVYDFFGNIYEKMFQSGKKAASMGQFFTPQTVANLCSHIIYEDARGQSVVNEPTCGSGRNLLAIFAENKNKAQYYIAEDLDSTSVKMCAINMLLHGMRGCCVCHNTLLPDDFIFGYEINEVRYPFPCECYSIRSIDKTEYLRRTRQ